MVQDVFDSRLIDKLDIKSRTEISERLFAFLNPKCLKNLDNETKCCSSPSSPQDNTQGFLVEYQINQLPGRLNLKTLSISDPFLNPQNKSWSN